MVGALTKLEESLAVWERWALEPEEKDAIRRALDALEELRKHVFPPAKGKAA